MRTTGAAAASLAVGVGNLMILGVNAIRTFVTATRHGQGERRKQS
jgi:hypothetical protein